MFGTPSLLDSAAPSEIMGAVQGTHVEHSEIYDFGDKGLYGERASNMEKQPFL